VLAARLGEYLRPSTPGPRIFVLYGKRTEFSAACSRAAVAGCKRASAIAGSGGLEVRNDRIGIAFNSSEAIPFEPQIFAPPPASTRSIDPGRPLKIIISYGVSGQIAPTGVADTSCP
jgi:hypothetical protein